MYAVGPGKPLGSQENVGAPCLTKLCSPGRQHRQPLGTQDFTNSPQPDRPRWCSSRGNTSCRTTRASTSNGGSGGATGNATSAARKCTGTSLCAGSAISAPASGARAIACRQLLWLRLSALWENLCLGVSFGIFGNFGRASWQSNMDVCEHKWSFLLTDRISAMGIQIALYGSRRFC